MKHFKLKKGVLACLLSLALAFSCFGGIGIKADEAASTETTVTKPDPVTAEFEWSTNSVKASSAAYVYVLKAKSGNAIKKGAKSVQLSQVEKTSTYAATMTELGVKVGKKDVYLYVCSKEFEADEASVSANLTIKAPAAKKVTGTVDYTKADYYGETIFDVISAKAVDNSKKEIKDPEIWWSTEADGTYYEVNDKQKAATPRKYADSKTEAPNGFDGRTLNEMLAAGGGTIYIKMAGVTGGDGTAQFGSKAVKVKIAKQAAAPKVKLDAKKDAFSIKNGFDFGFAEKKSDGTYEVQAWFTVLPQLKGAAVKESSESIVSTINFTPLGKKDTNAGKAVTSEDGTKTTYSYTAYKFKSISVDSILKAFSDASEAGVFSWDGDDVIIAFRKSATEKKPASAASYVELSAMAGNPLVYTQENVKGEYLVATATDFDKKGFTVGTIVPYPGSVSGEETRIATEGYSDSFKVGSVSGQTIVNADKDGSSFEFAILAQKDLVAEGENAIDVSTIGWKKLDPAKTKITSKLKTKYNTLKGDKKTATLDAVSGKQDAPANPSGSGVATDYSGVKNFLVIRRAGDSKSTVRSSSWIYLYVAKEGKEYKLYSTVDNGDEAFKYIVKFVKFQQVGDSYAWDLASDVEDVSVWAAVGDKRYVALPASTTAKLYKTGSASGATVTVLGNTPEEVESISGGTNKGKYEVEGVADGHTEYIAIREYANITVKQEISISGSTTKDVITYYQQKNGKVTYSGGSASSGEATFYVGDTFTLSTSGLPTCTSSSGATVAAGSGEGISFDNDGKATVTATTINTADEVVIVIPYVATPNYAVTVNAPTSVAVTLKKGDDASITSGATVPLGTEITVEVEKAGENNLLTGVKINGTEVTADSNGKATKTFTINAATTITVTDPAFAKE
jgi:hypothetical protein